MQSLVGRWIVFRRYEPDTAYEEAIGDLAWFGVWALAIAGVVLLF